MGLRWGLVVSLSPQDGLRQGSLKWICEQPKHLNHNETGLRKASETVNNALFHAISPKHTIVSIGLAGNGNEQIDGR